MTVKILIGDVRARLADLPDESVHCIWTSIPYWGLRSYGTEPQVWGGEADCAHVWGDQQRNGKRQDIKPSSETTSVGRVGVDDRQGTAVLDGGRFCQHCGAWRGEHGLEPTLDMWLQHEVEIWRELRRVLRKDGTAWLNCGDAYATSTNGRSAADTKKVGKDDRTFRDKPISTAVRANKGNNGGDGVQNLMQGGGEFKKHGTGLLSKQRLMLPARVALALQSDGWWLRDEIVWHKPNPMPSSIKDRTTPAHEMLYLLTRSARYYFDPAAIAEPAAGLNVHDMTGSGYAAPGQTPQRGNRTPVSGWAKGPGSHSAVDHNRPKKSGNKGRKFGEERGRPESHMGGSVPWEGFTRNKRSVWTVNTEPFPGAHFATAPTELVRPCILAGCPKGGTVLDPFFGAGTTGLVADRLERNCIGIELNEEYAEIAERRLQSDAGMFAEVIAA